MPSKLASNVRLIVSIGTAERGLQHRLEKYIESGALSLSVPSLSHQDCMEIIKLSLGAQARQLNNKQWHLVSCAFNACKQPLFVKMTLEEVRRWRSYEDVSLGELVCTLHGAIDKFFERLERKHGRTLVSHVLAYFCVVRCGLSEVEMEDVLSLDDEVLNSIFVFWEAPTRRIPPVVWCKLRNDIRGFLVGKNSDETTVLSLQHEEFRAVIRERYFTDTNLEKIVHENLGHFWLGTWGGYHAKAFKYEKFHVGRLKLKSPDSSACRHLPQQPIILNRHGEIRYNLRKLNQMPYHLAKAGMLEKLMDHVFFHYDWLHGKLCARGIHTVLADFKLVKGKDAEVVCAALRMCQDAITSNPDVLCLELSGRLLPYYHTYSTVRKLLRECDTAAQAHCPIVPHHQVYTTPGGPLEYVLEVDQDVLGKLEVDIIQTHHTVLLTVKPEKSTILRVWDVQGGDRRADMEVLPGKIVPSRNGKFLHVFYGGTSLKTYETDSAEEYGEVTHGTFLPSSVAVGDRYVAFVNSRQNGPVVVDVMAGRLLHHMSYSTQTVAISNDDRFLICAVGEKMYIHQFPVMELRLMIKTDSSIERILFTVLPSEFLVLSREKGLCKYVMDLKLKRSSKHSIYKDIQIQDFLLSPTGSKVLVRSSRRLSVFSTSTTKLCFSIERFQNEAYIEELSTFSGAGFSPKDRLLLATRHTYLGVWNGKTGEPLRLLQTSVSPTTKLFTSPVINKAITLLEDNSVQVWDLDNLDTDVLYSNAVMEASVQGISVSTEAGRAAIFGDDVAEVKVIDMTSGSCVRTIPHSTVEGDRIKEVVISPKGNYVVTRGANSILNDPASSWEKLREDKIWNINKGKLIHRSFNNRFALFAENEDEVILITVKHFNENDWADTCYRLDIVPLRQGYDLETKDMFPADIVSEPFLVGCPTHVACLMQKCHKMVELKREKARELDRRYEVVLCLQQVRYNSYKNAKIFSLKEVWKDAPVNSNFLDVGPAPDKKVFLIFGYGSGNFEYAEDGTAVRSFLGQKGALIFDPMTCQPLKILHQHLKPSSDVDNCTISQGGCIIMDDARNTFNVVTGKFMTQLPNSFEVADSRFALDGKFLIAISRDRREILVFRCCDGVQKARFFVHGIATCLEVGTNGRTFVIGTQDGRIMTFSLILDFADPTREWIHRTRMQLPRPIGKEEILKKDTELASSKEYDQRRLSARIQTAKEVTRRKVSGYKTVTTAMELAHLANHASNSRACSIQ